MDKETVANIKSQTKKTLVDIVVPVHNDAHVIPASIAKLSDFLAAHFPYSYVITIVENGSSDNSWEVTQSMVKKYPKVRALKVEQGGRGRALKYAWERSHGDILAYMDVDLSTDLSALEPMITPLVEGKYELATGTRLSRGSKIDRSLNREFISRVYNYIVRLVLDLKTSDAQCGFKAIRATTAKKLLPEVSDNNWFFDSELLVKAEHQKLKVHEVAVIWHEDPDSRVKIVKTAIDNLKGIKRVRSEFSGRAKWEIPALSGVLVLAAVIYLVSMSNNAYGNGFYAAAVQAGTHSWKAFFFGSLDGGNFISVDKPPLFLWVMEIFTRVLGFHPWSMILPDVLEGVASIGLLYATVRRWFSAKSALIAAIVMMLTPVGAMMFGYNNPEALLTLLLVASVYAFFRSIEGHHSLLWLSISGILIGLGFNTKMLQALLILPILVAVYLYAAPFALKRRLKNLAIVAIPTAVVGLWWSVIVWLTPAASRPYIGSSGNNSIWSLIFGYNGFGRLLGGPGQTGDDGALNAGVGTGGSKGVFRMFNSSFGPGIAWLIILALIGLILVLYLKRSTKPSNKTKVAALVFGGWLIIHMIIFSMVGGIIHSYYAAVMAPAIGGLIGISLPLLIKEYRQKTHLAFLLPLSVVATGILACILLGYDSAWLGWLRWVVLDLSVLSAAGLVLDLVEPKAKLSLISLCLAAIASMAGPISYSLATVMAGHSGALPQAGPTGVQAQTISDQISPSDRAVAKYLLAHRGNAKWLVAVNSSIDSAPLQIAANEPVMAIGGFDGSDNALSLNAFKKLIVSGQLKYYAASPANGVFGLSEDNAEIYDYVQTHARRVNYQGSNYLLYQL